MPYAWRRPEGADGPVAELTLWPYRSLSGRGFVTFFAITAGLLTIPLLAVLGSIVLWGLLPFVLAALGGLWWGIGRSWRDGRTVEQLRLWPDRMTLTRRDPAGTTREWSANPHWVRVSRHETGGPVPAYLTLRGNGREVEIGAFLSEPERRALERELREAIGQVVP